MKIHYFKKMEKGRRYKMAKLDQKLSAKDLLIDKIEKSSNDDWDELCTICSSLIKEAKMTDHDIDDILKKVKNGVL